jgi:hypothetical protein
MVYPGAVALIDRAQSPSGFGLDGQRLESVRDTALLRLSWRPAGYVGPSQGRSDPSRPVDSLQ